MNELDRREGESLRDVLEWEGLQAEPHSQEPVAVGIMLRLGIDPRIVPVEASVGLEGAWVVQQNFDGVKMLDRDGRWRRTWLAFSQVQKNTMVGLYPYLPERCKLPDLDGYEPTLAGTR